MALDPAITKSLIRQTPKETRVQVQKLFGKAFQKIKNQMIAEFLNHPVTIELKGGLESPNISGTLGGKSGNLFSFIGFNSGEDPTKAIEEILQNTEFRFLRLTTKSIEFSVSVPDAKEVFAATPMPWAPGRSWAKGIESGISGLGYYINRTNSTSRSGRGVQTSKPVSRGSRFKNTQYISAILKKYKKQFENIQL